MPDRAVFLDLVDEVLKSINRPPLNRSGPQRKIITVEPTDRVLQILAGPGSGKTEMLVWRIIYQLVVLGTPAERLMATTFTRKAATELEIRLVERTDALLAAAHRRGVAVKDPHVHDVKIGTLHSLCDRLLGEFDDAYATAGTQLVDETEALVRLAREMRWTLGYVNPPAAPRLVNRLVDTAMLTALFRAPWDGEQWPGSNLARVSYVRDLLNQHIETWMPRCAATGTRNGVELVHGPTGLTDDLVQLHDRWVEYLDGQSIMDFAAIQERFLERQAGLLDNIDHVFVDEFQDTNPIQFEIHMGWLAKPESRLTVVGDDDQALYRFRGSDIACFLDVEKVCADRGVTYRRETLEHNYRSSTNIVRFTEDFRSKSVLGKPGLTLPKTLRPAPKAKAGPPVRLLVGDWGRLSEVVAAELKAAQSNLLAAAKKDSNVDPALDAAVLLFSTSEKRSRTNIAPAATLRDAIETRGLRVYNPRNKTAGLVGSPIHDLLALISYLVDPVRKVTVGRPYEVNATHREDWRWDHADAAPPTYRISDEHASVQKQFRKSEGGTIEVPSPLHADLLDYIDQVRDALVRSANPRMTLQALVARLLTFPRFRHCGYTANLFRQAQFTSLLEANVAPTRRSRNRLDEAMNPTRNSSGQIEWPKQYWDLLNVFGAYLKTATIDDVENDAFADNAIAVLTFHQAKGLEFDHVYVGCTGRDVSPANVLRTKLFSGERVRYKVAAGQAETTDRAVLELAQADREREVYVALTRAKQYLTVLHDPNDDRPMMRTLNPGIEAAVKGIRPKPHPLDSRVRVFEFHAGEVKR